MLAHNHVVCKLDAKVVAPVHSPQKIHMATGNPVLLLSSTNVVRHLSLRYLRACVAAGNLADQVTYPVRIEPADRTLEVEAKLQELLDLVGVGYLVTRWAGDAVGKKRADHKGWDHETKWEEVLSESCVCPHAV